MPAANNNPTTLPPPSTFDIIPPLHTTLSRLLLSDSATSPTSPSSNGNRGPLSPKDLAAAVSEVRARIARASSIIAGMQDSDRTIEDQKEEIRELKAVLEKIGKPEVLPYTCNHWGQRCLEQMIVELNGPPHSIDEAIDWSSVGLSTLP
ncbi:MAG: hypothetical protein LQ339_000629 [Xanthoria mediterranea]|nr:MAG: hypothetical protein LQ339_000629 [Xanthoria mediterranea]